MGTIHDHTDVFFGVTKHIFEDEDGHKGIAYNRDDAMAALREAQYLDVEYVEDRAGRALLGSKIVGRKVKRDKN